MYLVMYVIIVIVGQISAICVSHLVKSHLIHPLNQGYKSYKSYKDYKGYKVYKRYKHQYYYLQI